MSHRIVPIEELPPRKYVKRSIYDDVIEDFQERKVSLAKIEMTKKDGVKLEGTYLSGRLRKRLAERNITDIRSITVNKEAYLEIVEG